MNHTLESIFICRNEDFHRWIEKRLQGCWGKYNEEMAANYVRECCGIASRSELKTSDAARAKFEALLKEFRRDRAEELTKCA
jgi:hypothetical protein